MSSRWILRSGDNNARLTESRNARDQTATRDDYKVANQQRKAVRRALEWIRASKAQLVFKDEISDLVMLNCDGSFLALLSEI